MTSTRASERLFKYPLMERQDLNQSQLGSFKFTPVDSVDSIQSLTQSAKQFLEQQLSHRQHRPYRDGTPASSPERDTLRSKTLAGDAEFFNTHIKPDLGDSRLRLGPAALRTAVDGATSPAKKCTAAQVRQDSEPTLIYGPPRVLDKVSVK
jgi:hypothetical protein